MEKIVKQVNKNNNNNSNNKIKCKTGKNCRTVNKKSTSQLTITCSK